MTDNDKKMEGLLTLQQALNSGLQYELMSDNFLAFSDTIEGKSRYWFANVVAGEVLSLATFREEEKMNGISCYSVNYSVSEKHRGNGLATKSVNKGIDELIKYFQHPFYIDAIINELNISSIKVAKKIFPGDGKKINDQFTGVPSIIFHKLIRP